MTEETLAGGNTVGATRIGDIVHKRASPWTPTVHALLRHLEEAGFDGAPRARGFDDQGREMVTFLPGEAAAGRYPWPAWTFTDTILTQVGQYLRRLHDLTEGFRPPGEELWFTGRTMQPGLVVGHQDAGPYNAAVLDGDRFAGFFDWDTAFPATREYDLGFAAIWWVPLCPPDVAEGVGFHTPADRSRRLHLLLDAYGYEGDRHAFGAAVVQRARHQAGVMRRMAETGDQAAIALLDVAGYIDVTATEVEGFPPDFWAH